MAHSEHLFGSLSSPVNCRDYDSKVDIPAIKRLCAAARETAAGDEDDNSGAGWNGLAQAYSRMRGVAFDLVSDSSSLADELDKLLPEAVDVRGAAGSSGNARNFLLRQREVAADARTHLRQLAGWLEALAVSVDEAGDAA